MSNSSETTVERVLEIVKQIQATQTLATPTSSEYATIANQLLEIARLISIDTKLNSQATATRQDTGNTSLSSMDTKLNNQATASNQSATNSSLASIDTKLTTTATTAKQDTGNTSLASIDTKLNSQSTASNQATANTSLSSIDSKLTNQATAAKQDTGNSYLSSIAGTAITDGIHNALRVSVDPDYLSLNGEITTAGRNVSFVAKQTHDNLPLYFDRVNGGTGSQSYNSTLCLTAMTTSATNDYAIAQSFMKPNYTPGMTHCGELTFNNFQNQTNIYKRAGLFNGGIVAPYSTFDGVFLESDGVLNKYYACYANAGSVTRTEINTHGLTIDWSKLQAVIIRYLYLGGTNIQFSLVVGPQIWEIANIQLSNIITNPFVFRPNQSIRYEIRQVGAGSGLLNQICSTVFDIGDQRIEGTPRGANTGTTALAMALAGTSYLALAIRKRAGYLSVEVKQSNNSFLSTSNDDYYLSVIMNPTIAGAALSWNNATGSAVEYAVGGATNTVTGGYLMDVHLGHQDSIFAESLPSIIHLGSSIAGVSDILAVVITPLSAALAGYATINWVENQ